MSIFDGGGGINGGSGGGSGANPIGAIVYYANALTGIPALGPEYVQCNGQTITDAQSPLKGQVVPNLNNPGQFLRGATNSGAFGGATQQSVSVSTTQQISVTGSSSVFFTGSASLNTSNQNLVSTVIGGTSTNLSYNSTTFASVSISGSINLNSSAPNTIISQGTVPTMPPYYEACAVMRIK